MRRYEFINEANRIITLADALLNQHGTDHEQTLREEVRKLPRHIQDEMSDTIDHILRHRK